MGELKTPPRSSQLKAAGSPALVLHMKKKFVPILITAGIAIAAVYVWNNWIVPNYLDGKGTA